MPRVNDEYVEGVNNKLEEIQHELQIVMLGYDPQSTRPAGQALQELVVRSGSENYPAGWYLSGRVRWQGEGLHQAFDTESQRIGGFTSSVREFLAETDQTELENISAQEFQSYLPGDGHLTNTNTG